MGGHPYWYFVPYSENPKVALELDAVPRKTFAPSVMVG